MRNDNFLLTGLVVLLAGCASTTPAPVYDRTAPQAAEQAANIVLKPGEYLVKKGDTLYSIALDHGQDYKDVAAWSKLDNPNLIRIGQVLRVKPPEADAAVANGAAGDEVRPIAPPVQIESRSTGAASATPTPPTPTSPVVAGGTLKREPKGGTQIYSEEAWAQAQKPETVAATTTPTTASPIPAAQTTQPAKPATASANASSTSSAASTTAATATGDIAWTWPTANKLTASFSEGGNKGLDFNGAVGDPVLAAASGKVTLVTNSLRGYGNLIVIKHNANYLSVYAHNSKMLVSEGQAVSKGQKIAEIGSSDSDRPKLHFEIRREGKPVDPARFLP